MSVVISFETSNSIDRIMLCPGKVREQLRGRVLHHFTLDFLAGTQQDILTLKEAMLVIPETLSGLAVELTDDAGLVARRE